MSAEDAPAMSFQGALVGCVLSLKCSLCTRGADFTASTRSDAAVKSIDAGWTRTPGRDICPKCSAKRAKLTP